MRLAGAAGGACHCNKCKDICTWSLAGHPVINDSCVFKRVCKRVSDVLSSIHSMLHSNNSPSDAHLDPSNDTYLLLISSHDAPAAPNDLLRPDVGLANTFAPPLVLKRTPEKPSTVYLTLISDHSGLAQAGEPINRVVPDTHF